MNKLIYWILYIITNIFNIILSIFNIINHKPLYVSPESKRNNFIKEYYNGNINNCYPYNVNPCCYEVIDNKYYYKVNVNGDECSKQCDLNDWDIVDGCSVYNYGFFYLIGLVIFFTLNMYILIHRKVITFTHFDFYVIFVNIYQLVINIWISIIGFSILNMILFALPIILFPLFILSVVILKIVYKCLCTNKVIPNNSIDSNV